MSNKTFIYIYGIVLLILIASFVLWGVKSKKNAKKLQIKNSRGSMQGIFWLYKLYSNTPVLKRYYLKLRNNIEGTYPADELSVRRKTTLTMTKALALAFLVMVGIILSSKGDYFYIFMGLFAVYVIFTYYLTMVQDRYENILLEQLGNFITDVRHHYSQTGNVEDSIYDTLDDSPYEIGLHLNKIYGILTSTKMQKEVDAYTDVCPNKYLLMFVTVAATIKEYGDKKLENGESLFLKNINYLKEEINVEMLKKTKVKHLFSGLIALTLGPMLFLKAIERWMIGIIPEVEGFYTGSSGTIILAGIFIITLFVYQLISNLKDGHIDDVKEHRILEWLLKIPIINRMITLIINRNYSKQLRTDDNLKMVGDRIGIKGFFLKRVLFGILAVILCNAVIITGEARNKTNLLHDFSESFQSSLVPSEEYRQIMREAAESYMIFCKNMDDTPENRTVVKEKIANETGIQKSFAEEVVQEIFTHLEKYKNIYYRWYFILINIASFLFGFAIPYLILQYQLRIVKMDMEDEVVQFQTIVLILMHVDGMMIDTVLEWMERFSFCFKQTLQECIINLEYSTQKSLLKMKQQESFPPFRRFVDNLLMVDDEDIQTAFAEIETDREYYKEKRKEDNEISIQSKSQISSLIAFIPLMATLIFYLIVPFGIYAYNIIGTISGS